MHALGISVSFPASGGEAAGIDLPGYCSAAHRRKSSCPCYDPAHPGAILRDSVEEAGWTVTECARKLGVARNTLSRLLNEHIGISPAMALGLERIGWSNADFWMRVQGGYDLAQERLQQEAAAKQRTKSVRLQARHRLVASRRHPAKTARHRTTE